MLGDQLRPLDQPFPQVGWMSRPGARCRDCSRSVSPDLPPNPLDE
jgi:hypothetical protein